MVTTTDVAVAVPGTTGAFTPLTSTIGSAPKFVPVTVSSVPPAVGPWPGAIEVTAGRSKVNFAAAVTDWSTTVTATSASAAVAAGVVTTSCVPAAFTPVTGAATPPMVTAFSARTGEKLVPVIVSVVGATAGAWVTLRAETAGGS